MARSNYGQKAIKKYKKKHIKTINKDKMSSSLANFALKTLRKQERKEMKFLSDFAQKDTNSVEMARDILFLDE